MTGLHEPKIFPAAIGKVDNDRMLWTCGTAGCEVVGFFTNEPGHCSICLEDLTGVYDTTGELVAEEVAA